MRHIFGPVISRRLGRSLGVDPVGSKTCSFDCVYCECGKTDRLAAVRERFFPPEELLDEVRGFLAAHPNPDWITFGGSGEPLLSLDFPLFTQTLRSEYPDIRQALLTNSTFLDDPRVQSSLSNLDLILPSLDAAFEESYQKINRPHPELSFKTLVNSLQELKEHFSGQIWLELFVIPGINDSEEEIREFHRIIKKIAPDQIQLNTLDRPGVVKDLKKADAEALTRFSNLLNLPNTQIIARSVLPDNRREVVIEAERKILHAAGRRPCTREELLPLSDLSEERIDQLLGTLVERGALEMDGESDGALYRLRT